MKNKYFLFKILLIVLIVCMVALTGRYYQHKKDLTTNDDTVKKDEPPKTTKPSSSSTITTTKPTTTKQPDVPGTTEPKGDEVSNPSSFGLKKPTTFKEFDELAKRETNTMFVFGRTGCVHCEKYYPILEEVASLKKIGIVYVNLANFSEEDYLAVLNSNVVIPGKCVNEGIDKKLADGFGTPLSLFINKYETYDCIRGYKNKTDLITILQKVGYIK